MPSLTVFSWGEQDSGIREYNITLPLSNLQSSSVKKENFTIIDAVTGEDIAPKSAVYLPQQNQVILAFDMWGTPSSACRVYMNQNVLCVGGNPPAEEDAHGEVTHSRDCDIYGVSVSQLTFEQGGVKVLKPTFAEEFKVRVSVINTTKDAKQCEIGLHLNDETAEPINKNDEKRVITIGGDETAEYDFIVSPEILGGAVWGRIYATVK